MKLIKIINTVVVNVETQEVLASNTSIEKISDVEIKNTYKGLKGSTNKKRASKSIQDAVKVIGFACEINPINRSFDDVLIEVKKRCNREIKRISQSRGIGETTVRANIVRGNNLESAQDFYEGITRFLVEGDVSLAEHLIECAQVPAEEELIIKAFNAEV